jgi:cytochrome c
VPHPMLKRRCVLAITVAPLLLAGLSTRAPGQQPERERGRALVERECARCHAVSRTGQSRHKSAPPFRDLSKKYPVESLAEALAEGIVVGHKDMPEFIFEPDDVGAILAYISSLGE